MEKTRQSQKRSKWQRPEGSDLTISKNEPPCKRGPPSFQAHLVSRAENELVSRSVRILVLCIFSRKDHGQVLRLPSTHGAVFIPYICRSIITEKGV